MCFILFLQILFSSRCRQYGDVVHVVAEGSKDTIHYVYSSNRLPSVLIARTNTTTKLQLDCSQFHDARSSMEAGSVRFSHPPDAVMVLVFTRVRWHRFLMYLLTSLGTVNDYTLSQKKHVTTFSTITDLDYCVCQKLL